jgi:tetratricopeptide (TPR) repeat protein
VRIRLIFLATIIVGGLIAAPRPLPAAAPAAPAPAPSAGTTDEAARKLCFDGRWLLIQNRLDEAIDRLQLAVAVDPRYEEAVQLLAQARTRRAEAQKCYDAAVALAKQGQWDEALRQAQAALGPFPAYPQAKALVPDLKRQATEALLAAGQALVAAGNLGGAEAVLGQAMGYAADPAPVHEALGRVDFLRGKAAAARGAWGAAFLWFSEAAEFSPTRGEYKDPLRAARTAVIQRVQFSLALDRTAPLSAAGALLRDATWKRLVAARPDFLALAGAQEWAGQASFTAAVDVASLDVKELPARTENKTLAYKTVVEERNPDYDRTLDQLSAARDYLARLAQDYNAACPYCLGYGWVRCRYCGGTGMKPTPPPGTPCPVCALSGRPGWLPCPYCGGAGHGTVAQGQAITRTQRDITSLQTGLARLPATVSKPVTGEWPYAVQIAEKTGTLAGGLRVIAGAAGQAVAVEAVRCIKRFESSTILNPRPEIGLKAAAAVLPTDEVVRQAVLEDAAAETAEKILAAALGARAATLQTTFQKLLADGKTGLAIEMGADAAVIKEAIGKEEAARLKAFLRDRMRIEERWPNATPAVAAPVSPVSLPPVAVPPPPVLPPPVPPAPPKAM